MAGRTPPPAGHGRLTPHEARVLRDELGCRDETGHWRESRVWLGILSAAFGLFLVMAFRLVAAALSGVWP